MYMEVILFIAADNAASVYCLHVYGGYSNYEFQGDNLFIARVNVLRCFVDYYRDKWNEMPTKDTILKMINIIVWNFWQMDGLKDTIPFSDTPAKIIDWKLTNRNHTEVIEFRSCKE